MMRASMRKLEQVELCLKVVAITAAVTATPAPVARFKSKIERLLAINIPPLNGSNVIQWIEDKLSLRYIRLALEDGCKSCIWHPSLRAIHASNAPPTNACKAETMHCE